MTHGLSAWRACSGARRIVVAMLVMALAFVGLGPVQADAASRFRTTPTPAISGTAKVGSTLKVKAGTWKPRASVEVQWLRNGKKIKGATHKSYTLTPSDEGKKISVTVTGMRRGYKAVSKTSRQTKSVAQGALTTATPNIVGTFRTGEELNMNTGFWGPKGVKTTIQWLRNGKAIQGATKQSYTLTADDAGKKVAVKVTGTKKGYKTASKTSKEAKVGPGTLVADEVTFDKADDHLLTGDKLTALPREWMPSGVSFSYQWLRNGKAISGATGKSYVLTTADERAMVSVKVIGSKKGFETKQSTSRAVRVNEPGDVSLRTIEDPYLRYCIERELDVQDGVLPLAELNAATELNCKAGHISSLKGFPKFPHLVEFDATHNFLTSVDGLPALPRLEILNLQGNRIVDLDALPALPELRGLYLFKSEIKSLRGLPERTPKLDNLMVQLGGEDVDLSVFPEFGQWQQLTILSIIHSDVARLDGLASMPQLKQLGVVTSTLADVTGMPDLPHLSTLAITDSKLTSLDGLPELARLEHLIVFDNEISSVSGLASRTGLKDLRVYGNPLTDIDADKAALQPLADAGCEIQWSKPAA